MGVGWLRRSFQRILGQRKSQSSEVADAIAERRATFARIQSDSHGLARAIATEETRNLAQAIAGKDEVEVDRDKILEVARWVSGVGESRTVRR